MSGVGTGEGGGGGCAVTPEGLAADHFEWARRIAAKLTANLPAFADEAESAALLGLWEAARNFDASRGLKFKTFAGPRVVGAIKDAMRAGQPKGLRSRRKDRDRESEPATINEYDLAWDTEGRSSGNLALVPSGDGPVGWEIEYDDEVTALSRRLPREQQRAFRASYLDCRGRTMKGAGVVVGMSESRVSQIHTFASVALRESIENREHLEGRFMQTQRNGKVPILKRADLTDDDTAALAAIGRADPALTPVEVRERYHAESGRAVDARAIMGVLGTNRAGRPGEAESGDGSPPYRRAALPSGFAATNGKPRVPAIGATLAPRLDFASFDSEVVAIGAVWAAIKDLDATAARRVIGWASDRAGLSAAATV
jgi:RNA polymerase sigma factor (sigma-70 family)